MQFAASIRIAFASLLPGKPCDHVDGRQSLETRKIDLFGRDDACRCACLHDNPGFGGGCEQKKGGEQSHSAGLERTTGAEQVKKWLNRLEKSVNSARRAIIRVSGPIGRGSGIARPRALC